MKTLLRALALLPLPLLHGMGACFGWLAFAGSAGYRQRFLQNARRAGYPLSTVRQAVAAAGRLVTEVPRLWFGRPVPIDWEGASVIDDAVARGKGIVFLTPHLGCFEVSAQAFALRYGRITVLYRPARKAWLRDLVDTARARSNLQAAPTTMAGVRQMLKALRAGEAVGLLPDQVPPEGLGEWAPFFGGDAYTMTLSTRLAQQTGAAIVLAWAERLPWGRGFRVHLRPWTEAIASDPKQAAAQVNARMEALIRECPQQYLWGYARYKTPRTDTPRAEGAG